MKRIDFCVVFSSESRIFNLYVKVVLFHKIATFDETHIFNNIFTKYCIILPITTLLSNVALFRLHQQFYQILHCFAHNNTFTKYCTISHTTTVFNGCTILYFATFHEVLSIVNSKYKLSTASLHKCCLFLN